MYPTITAEFANQRHLARLADAEDYHRARAARAAHIHRASSSRRGLLSAVIGKPIGALHSWVATGLL